MKYGEKYSSFKSLLLYFLILGEEEEPSFSDEETIKAYIYGTDILERQPHCKMPSWRDKNIEIIIIQRTIDQAKEVLKLEPFPESWIWDIAGGHSRPWPDTNISSCKTWLEWIIQALEKEFAIYKELPPVLQSPVLQESKKTGIKSIFSYIISKIR